MAPERLTVAGALAPVLRRWPELIDWPARLAEEDPRAVRDVAEAIAKPHPGEPAGSPPELEEVREAIRLQAEVYREKRPEPPEDAAARSLRAEVMREVPDEIRPGGPDTGVGKERAGAYAALRVFLSPGTERSGAGEQLYRFGLAVAAMRRLGVSVPVPHLDSWVELATGAGAGACGARAAEDRGRYDVLDLPADVLWRHLAECLLAAFRGRPRPDVPTGYAAPDEPAWSVLGALLAAGTSSVRLPGWMAAVADGMARMPERESDLYDPALQREAFRAFREADGTPGPGELRRALSGAILRSVIERARQAAPSARVPNAEDHRALADEVRDALAR